MNNHKINNMRTKKASTVGSIVIWFGIIASVGLIVLYGIPKIKPQQVELDFIYQDINSLQLILNKACITESLEIDFNPILRKGEVIIDSNQICINSSSFYICRNYQCSFDINRETFLIDELTLIEINKEEGEIEFRSI